MTCAECGGLGPNDDAGDAAVNAARAAWHCARALVNTIADKVSAGDHSSRTLDELHAAGNVSTALFDALDAAHQARLAAITGAIEEDDPDPRDGNDGDGLCNTCGGSGGGPDKSNRCQACQGSGEERVERDDYDPSEPEPDHRECEWEGPQ